MCVDSVEKMDHVHSLTPCDRLPLKSLGRPCDPFQSLVSAPHHGHGRQAGRAAGLLYDISGIAESCCQRQKALPDAVRRIAGMGRQAGVAAAGARAWQSVSVGKLNLVDLAGSERVHITGATGAGPAQSNPFPPMLATHPFQTSTLHHMICSVIAFMLARRAVTMAAGVQGGGWRRASA